MGTITVYYNGNGLLLQKDFAELNGYSHGYRIKTEAEYWDILGKHAEHNLASLRLLISAKKALN